MVAFGNRVSFSQSNIDDFCRRWNVCELSVFGSALRDDFRQDSDIDILIDFEAGTRHTIFNVVQMEDELTLLFGRKVDLVEKRAIAKSENYLRRRQILGSSQVIDHAG